jgi:hypothetical protein
VFHMDATKVGHDVAYVTTVVYICCNYLFQIFHLFFHVCYKCVYLDVHVFYRCICFPIAFQVFWTYMLQVIYPNIAKIDLVLLLRTSLL